MEKRKVKRVPSWHQWEGEDIRNGRRRASGVEYYALMNKRGKMRPAESPSAGEDETAQRKGSIWLSPGAAHC
jgi:hypothetical protein